jgi:hypothetical protein
MTKHTKGGVMKVKGSRRLVARLGLALAVAAVAVPGAQAMTINSIEGGGGVRLYADDLHAAVAPVPSRFQRQYADDLHAQLVSTSLPASNVRTDAATVPISLLASNVRTDASTVPISAPASNVQTDAASFRGPSPITDARHIALLRHNAQLGQEPIQLASASSDGGIDWSVAGVGAVLGAFGLMLLIGVVYFTGRHNRRSRLAAT